MWTKTQDQNMQSLLAQLVQAMPGCDTKNKWSAKWQREWRRCSSHARSGIKIHPDDPFLDPGFIGQMFHAQTIDSMVKLQDAVEKLLGDPDANYDFEIL